MAADISRSNIYRKSEYVYTSTWYRLTNKLQDRRYQKLDSIFSPVNSNTRPVEIIFWHVVKLVTALTQYAHDRYVTFCPGRLNVAPFVRRRPTGSPRMFRTVACGAGVIDDETGGDMNASGATAAVQVSVDRTSFSSLGSISSVIIQELSME